MAFNSMGKSGALAKIAGTSASGGGNYINDGVYRLMVESVIYKPGHEGDCFIAELRVLEAAPSIEGVKPSPVGSTASMVCNLTKHESAAGNAKAFVVALLCGMGYTPDQFEGPPGSPQAAFALQCMEAMCDAKNPMRGSIIDDATFRKEARQSKKILTLNKWKSVEGQTLESIKVGRDYLDKTPPAAQPAAAPAVVQPVATAPAAAPALGGPLAGLLR